MAAHSSTLAWKIPWMEEAGPREAGLLLRCAGKAGNPFQTTQGLDPAFAYAEPPSS